MLLSGLFVADLGEHVIVDVLQKPFSWHQHNNISVRGHFTKYVVQISISIRSQLLLVVNLVIVVLLGKFAD